MKKLLLSTTIIGLLSCAPVFANDVSLGINVGGGAPPSGSLYIGQPAVVVAPQPVIVAQPQTVIVERPEGYDPHHRDHDARYWRERRERERREHERHEHDNHHHDHDDHHEHHDRDGHYDHDDRR